jgi:hypothetical protein
MSDARDEQTRRHPPAAGEVPNEDEVAAEFPHGTDEPLVEQLPVHDREGDDIRQYTGEPVETEHGTVLPQQMVTGSQTVVGGGEFPNTPGRFEPDDEHVGGDRAADERESAIDGDT